VDDKVFTVGTNAKKVARQTLRGYILWCPGEQNGNSGSNPR